MLAAKSLSGRPHGQQPHRINGVARLGFRRPPEIRELIPKENWRRRCPPAGVGNQGVGRGFWGVPIIRLIMGRFRRAGLPFLRWPYRL